MNPVYNPVQVGSGVMQVTIYHGMVNIDSHNLAYSNIENLYKSGDGFGLQLDETLTIKENEIIVLCHIVAENLYKLQRITNSAVLFGAVTTE